MSEKLGAPMMVRMPEAIAADVHEMARISGNTPAGIIRLATEKLVEYYRANGRRISFPLEVVFAEVLMAAEDQGEYRTGKDRRKDRPADDEQVG